MKLRLHEIEIGTKDPEKSRVFYNEVLGLDMRLSQPELKVMDPGSGTLDLNASTHFPAGITCLSFVTEDLGAVMRRLEEKGILFEPPRASHLGMQSISLQDPDGIRIRINTPSEASPEWLKYGRGL